MTFLPIVERELRVLAPVAELLADDRLSAVVRGPERGEFCFGLAAAVAPVFEL